MSNNFYNLTDKQLAVFIAIMDGKHNGNAPGTLGALFRLGLIAPRWKHIGDGKYKREGWYVMGRYKEKYEEWSEEQ